MNSRFTIRRMTSRTDDVRLQVDVRELLGDEVEQVGLGQAVDLRRKVEVLEYVAHLGRERLDVAAQVLGDVRLVSHQLLQVEGGRVVEVLARLLEKERSGIEASLGPQREFMQNRLLGRLQHAVEAAEHGERENDLAVVGLLVVAAEQVRDGPDER
jgi:hypothetical protein